MADAPRKPRPRGLDAVDGELIEGMLVSRGWQLTRQRLEHELAMQQAALEQPTEEVRTAYIRGMIAALRLAIGLPDRIAKEAKSKGGIE